jgi:hypothetical protein
MKAKEGMTLDQKVAFYIELARKHGYPLVIRFLCEVIEGEQQEAKKQ